ncbi:MAG: hypothetical protein CML29_06010 [Rhizobiales bacterium]|nr:hypothetical protein [Hyphomicrobiales bacterium]MBA69543.1 hypothetical protein [Hyphomicrobiales bacterium]
MFRTILPVALPLVLGACQATPPEGLADAAPLLAPADPDRYAAPVAAPRVVTGYTHREPVDPGGWRQLNDSQAPSRGGGS